MDVCLRAVARAAIIGGVERSFHEPDSPSRTLLFLHREGLVHFAQPIESKSAVTAICAAVRTIAHATYSLSAPWRLTPWTKPWS